MTEQSITVQSANTGDKQLATSPKDLAFLKAPSLSANFMALGQGQSEAVQKSVVRSGEFYLQAQEPERSLPIGTFDKRGGKLRGQIEGVYGGYRPKALLLINNVVAGQSFNTDDPMFKKIVATQEVKAGQGPHQITPMFGTEILLYLPPHMFDWKRILANTASSWDEASISPMIARFREGCLASFFFAKSNKEYSPAGEYENGTPFVLRSDMRESPKFSWWVTPDRTILNIDNSNEAWVTKGRQMLDEQLPGFLAQMTAAPAAVPVESATGPENDR